MLFVGMVSEFYHRFIPFSLWLVFWRRGRKEFGLHAWFSAGGTVWEMGR
jgi:hypothetical protein